MFSLELAHETMGRHEKYRGYNFHPFYQKKQLCLEGTMSQFCHLEKV